MWRDMVTLWSTERSGFVRVSTGVIYSGEHHLLFQAERDYTIPSLNIQQQHSQSHIRGCRSDLTFKDTTTKQWHH